MELASRNASPPPVVAAVPSPEKSTYLAITRLPAGEPVDANAGLRRKSGFPTKTPSARNATLTPRPMNPRVALGPVSLMLASASGFSWGCAPVPHDATRASDVEVVLAWLANLVVRIGSAGPGIVAFGSTDETSGLRDSAAACAEVTRTVIVSGTDVEASTVAPTLRASDATLAWASRSETRAASDVGAPPGRRKTSIAVGECPVVAAVEGGAARGSDTIAMTAMTAIQVPRARLNGDPLSL